MPKFLNAHTASQFPANTNDGFARPMYGWSAFGPEHLDSISGSSMTSNVWYGKPSTMLGFIEKLAAHYESIKNDVERDDRDGVSLAYWEKDGLAMIAEFCRGDAFYNQKSDVLDEKAQELPLLLGDGNDNNAGMILTNQGELELDVPTRLKLANFMNSSAQWVLDEAAYDDSGLKGFTNDDKAQLLATLQAGGASQIITVQGNPMFEGKTFVVTGTMERMNRHSIESAITSMGGNIASSISRKTFAVIAGPDASPTKLEKAVSLGKCIWDETTFVTHAGTFMPPLAPAMKAKLPQTLPKSVKSTALDNLVLSELLTGLSALNFPDDTCDGFVPPKAAWSSMDPKKMLEGVGGSSMSSAMWVGSPKDVMRFADALVLHLQRFMETPAMWDGAGPDESKEGVAVAYWQNDGVAMCGEFCTWPTVALIRHSDEINTLAAQLIPVLFKGNDNKAGTLLRNESAELDVQTRLKLAACMNRASAGYVLDMYAEDKEALPGFTDVDRDALDAVFRSKPFSQFILSP